MKIKGLRFVADGNEQNRTLTQYPIVMIDGIYTGALDISYTSVTVADGIYSVDNYGADNFNVGFTGIRCNQGQAWGTQQIIKTVGVGGFYHGVEFGSEHWLINDLAVIHCHMGIACGCYHDTYGSGHPNVFNIISIERNYYPMYWYHNNPYDSLNWVGSGALIMNGLGTEWYKYTYGGEITPGCHIEHYDHAPMGIINWSGPIDAQFFDKESRGSLMSIRITKYNILYCHKWSNVYGTPPTEHGIQTLVGEQGQMCYLIDKQCYAIWNNYNLNNPYGYNGWWERLDGTPIDNN
jgi:hypothetical protein